MYCMSREGVIYVGDMQPGDRVATTEEVAAKQLGDAKADQLATLSRTCQASIYAGFTSSALGAAYTYPAKPTDQQNLAASVLDSVLPGLPADWITPFWCADAAGAWALRAHTVAQIQRVGVDGKAAIIAAIQRHAALEALVQNASTIEAVQAIKWSAD